MKKFLLPILFATLLIFHGCDNNNKKYDGNNDSVDAANDIEATGNTSTMEKIDSTHTSADTSNYMDDGTGSNELNKQIKDIGNEAGTGKDSL